MASDDLRARIAEALHADACPEDPDEGEACSCGSYEREADAVLAVVQPERDRLTEERDRLRDEVHGHQMMRWPEEAHRLQRERDDWKRAAKGARREFVETHDALEAAIADRDEARAALARVEAQAEKRDVLYPPKFGRTPSENYVMGYRAARSDLRTALRTPDGGSDE